MLVSGVVLGLYFWVFFSGAESVTSVLIVHDYAAIAAGVAFVIATIAHFWSPRKHLFATALVSYALLLTMIVILLTNTGQVSSPFIALWMLAAVFSPIFGWHGVILVIIVTLSFMGLAWTGRGVDTGLVAGALFTSALPVVIGTLGLRPAVNDETSEDRSYTELASELSAVSNKAEVVISAIADGVIAIDKTGMIQLINPAAQRLIGWDHKDALGLDVHSVLKLIDNRDQPVSEASNPINTSIHDNQQVHTDAYSLQTADTGKKFIASITVSPLGGMGSGSIIVFRDVTKEKAHEREQSEFISTASHEMRTPVASIEGYLGLALSPRTAQIDDRARDFITKAQESAQHLGRLFQDLLDVTRADDGRLKNDPKIVDVVPFFHDVVQGLLPKANEKHLIINYIPMPDLYDEGSRHTGDRTLPQVLYVNVDNDHLREVLSNLTENAIKYTLTGTISIDITGTNDQVTISVTDTGIGIPQEDIGHLFQKFYRVDNTSTREIGGTGLGLYLCRRMVEAMGGKIWAESVYQQGSTFYVRLPRVDHVEASKMIQEQSLRASEEAEKDQQAAQAAAVAAEAQSAPAPQPPAIAQPKLPPSPIPPHPDATPEMQPQTPPQSPPTPTTSPLGVAASTSSEVLRPSLEALTPRATNITPPRHSTPGENIPLSVIERNPARYMRTETQPPPRTPPPQ